MKELPRGAVAVLAGEIENPGNFFSDLGGPPGWDDSKFGNILVFFGAGQKLFTVSCVLNGDFMKSL